MTVYADTYALIGWLSPRDAAHPRVVEYLNTFTGRLVTTEWVLMELAYALSFPETRQATASFLKRIREDRGFHIVGYDVAVYAAGFDLYVSRPDKAWSLTDCISFTVMKEFGLTDALTADHHFEQAGFRAVFR